MKTISNFTSIEPEKKRFCSRISGGLDKVVEERLAGLVAEVDVAGILLEGRVLRLARQRGDLVGLLGAFAGGEGLPWEHGEDDRDGEAQRSDVHRRHAQFNAAKREERPGLSMEGARPVYFELRFIGRKAKIWEAKFWFFGWCPLLNWLCSIQESSSSLF